MRRTLASLLLLGLAGCPSESVEAVVAKRRPAVEAAFARIRDAAPTVLAAPPRTEAGLEAVAVKLTLGGTATFVHSEDLPSPGGVASVPVRTFDSQALLHCGSLLTKGTFYEPLQARVNVKAADAALARCEALRYLLVVRGARYEAPTADEAQRTFAPGTLEGDVVVFDLARSKVVGGFPYAVTNERTLQVPEGEPQLNRLQRNLESELYTQLRARLEALAPGAVPPSPL